MQPKAVFPSQRTDGNISPDQMLMMGIVALAFVLNADA